MKSSVGYVTKTTCHGGCCLVGWMHGWLVGWVGWLMDYWLVGCMVGWMDGSNGWVGDWLANWLIGWLVGLLACWVESRQSKVIKCNIKISYSELWNGQYGA